MLYSFVFVYGTLMSFHQFQERNRKQGRRNYLNKPQATPKLEGFDNKMQMREYN